MSQKREPTLWKNLILLCGLFFSGPVLGWKIFLPIVLRFGGATPTPPAPTITRFAIDYSATPNLAHLAQSNLAIVQPVLNSDTIRSLQAGGTRVVAYLTIGEVEPNDPALNELPPECILGQNPNWGSYYVDPGCPAWQNIVSERARNLRNAGYSGLFLDTVDTAEIFTSTQEAMANLICHLRSEVGGYLVQNRGFTVLKRTANCVDAVLYEDLSTSYDFATGFYIYEEQPPEPVLAYRDRLTLLALDYAPADRPALAWKACKRARDLGFVGYIAYNVNLHEGGAFCDTIPSPQPYQATTQGILRGTETIPIYGINWFGIETPDRAPHGLWAGRSVPDFLSQIRDLGFTALRLPISPQVLERGYSTPGWAQSNNYPADAYEGLLYFLEEARKANLYVLLDFHTYDPYLLGGSLPGSPFGGSYTKEDWLAHLRKMAEIALSFPNVFGIDICNEPYNLTWATWKELALDGARTVLSANPFIVVAVEGVGNLSNNGGWAAFWGENLTEAYYDPIVLDESFPPNRILYLTHTYGPSVYNQPYFDDSNFPSNMPAIWDVHFGRMAGQYPLGIGEFGGRYEGKDKTWQDAFVDYLLEKRIRIFFYWALNPNSGDTGGILLDDWRTVHEGKMNLLRRLMSQ